MLIPRHYAVAGDQCLLSGELHKEVQRELIGVAHTNPGKPLTDINDFLKGVDLDRSHQLVIAKGAMEVNNHEVATLTNFRPLSGECHVAEEIVDRRRDLETGITNPACNHIGIRANVINAGGLHCPNQAQAFCNRLNGLHFHTRLRSNRDVIVALIVFQEAVAGAVQVLTHAGLILTYTDAYRHITANAPGDLVDGQLVLKILSKHTIFLQIQLNLLML